jgi:hypothetical protein
LVEYVEGDLVLTVPEEFTPENFDSGSHGMSHCLKAVDYVFEIPSHLVFLEIKDPDCPPPAKIKEKKDLARIESEKDDFVRRFKSGAIDEELAKKHRDTWMYKRSEQKVGLKPIRYFVLLACKSLSSTEFLARTEGLRRKIPVNGRSGQDWSWLIEDCAVVSLEAWNKYFPKIPIVRSSAKE